MSRRLTFLALTLTSISLASCSLDSAGGRRSNDASAAGTGGTDPVHAGAGDGQTAGIGGAHPAAGGAGEAGAVSAGGVAGIGGQSSGGVTGGAAGGPDTGGRGGSGGTGGTGGGSGGERTGGSGGGDTGGTGGGGTGGTGGASTGGCSSVTPDACPGACTNLDTDAANCGACGYACAAHAPTNTIVTACVAGLCQYGCSPGFDDCSGGMADGCETDTAKDVNHCGACGRACQPSGVTTLACSEGLCTSACADPLLKNCSKPAAPEVDDGCETDLLADCSACGCVTETWGENSPTEGHVDDHQGVTIDTYIGENGTPRWEDLSAFNYGAATNLIVDYDPDDRALIRFDLSAIGAEATVIAARLHLFDNGNASAEPFHVLRATQAWVEGELDGTPGVCNWTLAEEGVGWSSPGANPVDATVYGSFVPVVPGAETVVAIDRELVQGWVSGAWPNHGFVIVSPTGPDGDGYHLKSSEWVDEAGAQSGTRPYLEIEYVP